VNLIHSCPFKLPTFSKRYYPSILSIIPIWTEVSEGASLAETIKLNCRVSERLNVTVKRAQIRYNGKGKALKKIVDLALADDANNRWDYKLSPPFGVELEANCTLTMSPEEYERTQPYRDRYLLTTKNAFFAFALQHGAVLYNEQFPQPAPIGKTAAPAAA